MLKRLATLLLGIGLIGLGVLLFVAPGGTAAMQWLVKLWPLFLILAGLVRVAGYLIDRHPRSPVGGMMITAVGGILLAANFRGDRSLLLLFGQYWFWLLLAFIVGRVLWQYTHRITDGQRARAFSAGAIALMIFLVGGGLASNYLAKNRHYLNGVEFKLGQMGIFGSEFSVEDEPPQEFTTAPDLRLVVNDFKGNVEIASATQSVPSARLIQRIRANNQEEANQIAKNIRLQLTSAGKNLQFSAVAENTQNDFSSTLLITLPASQIGGVEIVKVSGTVKLTGLRGDQIIRDSERIEIHGNTGKLTIDNSRSVALSQVQGDINLTNARGNLELREVKGAITLDARGGNVTIEQSSGPVLARVSDVRLTINDLRPAKDSTAQNQPILKLINASNSRINLQEIKGTVSISAERARIEAENIIGDLTVRNSSERVQVNRINGALKISAENASVEIAEVTGDAVIEATRDVTVRGFHGAINVTTSSGAINLSTDEKLAGNIKATSERGRIRVSIPEDSDFKLDTGSEGGRVRVTGFDDLKVPNRQRQFTAERNASANSPTVTLRSSRGDVELQSSGLALASRDNQDDGEKEPKEESKEVPKPPKPPRHVER